MRLKKHFYACICMLLIGIGSLQAKEVTLTEAGTLSGMISNEELNSLTELTVNGPVNGSDIKIIRAMGGTLKTLNMKNARIVEGGDSYYLTDKFTQNVNPERPDVPLNKNDAFQKVQKRRVQEKR